MNQKGGTKITHPGTAFNKLSFCSRAPGALLGLGSRRCQQCKRYFLSLAYDAVLPKCHNCHNGGISGHKACSFFNFEPTDDSGFSLR